MEIGQWLNAGVAAIALIVAGISAHSNTKLRLAISQFENTFVDRLNGRYIRKPDNAEDYPVTRREVAILEENARQEHKRLEAEIRTIRSNARASGGTA